MSTSARTSARTSSPSTRATVGTWTSDLTARLLRGLVAGVAAGGIFIALNAWFASSVGDPAEGPLLMISTIVLGGDAMAAGTANAALGMVIHALISVAYGVVFALLVPVLRTNGARALGGAVFGALLYVLNFVVIAPLAFPIFEMANQPFEFAAHVVFGTVLAFAFYERTAATPAPAPSG